MSGRFKALGGQRLCGNHRKHIQRMQIMSQIQIKNTSATSTFLFASFIFYLLGDLGIESPMEGPWFKTYKLVIKAVVQCCLVPPACLSEFMGRVFCCLPLLLRFMMSCILFVVLALAPLASRWFEKSLPSQLDDAFSVRQIVLAALGSCLAYGPPVGLSKPRAHKVRKRNASRSKLVAIDVFLFWILLIYFCAIVRIHFQ